MERTIGEHGVGPSTSPHRQLRHSDGRIGFPTAR